MISINELDLDRYNEMRRMVTFSLDNASKTKELMLDLLARAYEASSNTNELYYLRANWVLDYANNKLNMAGL